MDQEYVHARGVVPGVSLGVSDALEVQKKGATAPEVLASEASVVDLFTALTEDEVRLVAFPANS